MGVAVSLALALALTGVANADNRAVAREAYDEARRHYELDEFSAALEGFKRAYLAVDDPSLLFNIAQCHRQLGNRAEAIKFYRWFIRKVPSSPQRQDAEHIVATLEAQLAREPLPLAPAMPPHEPPPPAPTTTTIPTTVTDVPTPSLAPVAPASPVAPVAPALDVHASAPPRRTPVYKKWWLWTGLGVLIAGGAVAATLALTPNNAASPPGTYRVHFQ
jgi:tetratricopeptide (TPR) repeat protein